MARKEHSPHLLIWVTVTAGLWMTTAASPSGAVYDLYIIGLFPWTGGWHGGQSLLAATRIGIDVVNNMTNLLPGYRLNLLHNDTKCDPGLGIKILFEQLYALPTKIAILGDGCSIVSEATARASHLWNLVQISYVSKSPALSDKALYPKFARTSTPDFQTNPARIGLFQYFGWSRIATIHQTYELFSATIEDLLQKLKTANLTVNRSEIFREDPALQVRNLKKYDCRIIVGSFYEDKAKLVFCEAYKAGLYGRHVVWIIPGWYDPDWWLTDTNFTDCTPEQLAEAVEGTFSVSAIFLNSKEERSAAGWRPADFVAAYNESVGGVSLHDDVMAPQGFDAVLALALALNHTQQTLIDRGSPKRLGDFTYEDKEMGDLLYSSLLNVSFMGIRGPTSFDQNGDPTGLLKLDRVQGGIRRPVGLYKPSGSVSDSWEWFADNPIVWAGGFPPHDCTVIREVYVTLSVPLYATMSMLAAIGVLLTVGLLVFNITLRDVKVIKMSSPRVNNVILLGCMCAYSSIMVQDGGGGHGEIGCEVKTTLLAVGLSLTFGALFAKTWRVHIIFTTKLQKRVASDVHLIAMVGVLVALNMIVLVTWWLVDPRELKVTRESSSLVEEAAGEVLIQNCDRTCVSDYQLYFLGTLYAIHALVLFFGIFLAWETRKVHYPELNDSTYIGMCIYTVAVLCVPGVVVGVTMEAGVNLRYAVESAFILLGTTITQGLIFVPKVMAYRQSRVQADHGRRPTPHNTTGDNSSRLPSLSTQLRTRSASDA